MTKEEKEEYRKRLFDLHLQQAYYMMEHKTVSSEINKEKIKVKKEYVKKLVKEMIGDVKNG